MQTCRRFPPGVLSKSGLMGWSKRLLVKLSRIRGSSPKGRRSRRRWKTQFKTCFETIQAFRRLNGSLRKKRPDSRVPALAAKCPSSCLGYFPTQLEAAIHRADAAGLVLAEKVTHRHRVLQFQRLILPKFWNS